MKEKNELSQQKPGGSYIPELPCPCVYKVTSALGSKRERVHCHLYCTEIRDMTGTKQALQPKNEKQFIEKEKKKKNQSNRSLQYPWK